MFFRSLSSAVPERAWSQAECWQVLRDAPAVQALKPRSQTLLEKVLLGSNGIQTRHLCADDLKPLLCRDAQALNETFEAHAPKLAAEALRSAFAKAEIDTVDALFVCTCTGYLCPGLTSYVAESLGLPASTALLDISGAGCGAALPTLRAACNYLAAHPTHRAAVVAVEVCSAAFYLNDDPGVLISLCLFGDGAAALVLDGEEVRRKDQRFHSFRTLHMPEQREKIRFINREGRLCNQLHRAVPEIAAIAVEQLYPGNQTKLISHAGGRDVLEAIRTRLPDQELAEASQVLLHRGNCSSPSVLMALEHALHQQAEPENLWLTSFGAGFACHGCQLS